MILASPSGVSRAPEFGLIGMLAAAVILLVIAVRLWMTTRTGSSVAIRMTVCALVGIAAAFAFLVNAGTASYGRPLPNGDEGTLNACSSWYLEVGAPSGTQALPGDLSADCRHEAVSAIGGQLLRGLLVGVAAALVIAFVLWLHQWRRRRRPRGSTAGRAVERFVE